MEKGPNGAELRDRVGGPWAVPLRAEVAAWADVGPARVQGEPRLVDLGLSTPSTIGKPRRVVAWLPRSFSPGGTVRWPVLYALDGENLFTPVRSHFGKSWDLHRAVDEHAARGGPELLVIAVDSSERAEEYPPTRTPGGGRFGHFARFLLDELKPRIDAALPTLAGPEETAVLGSSLGGICALRLGWSRPDRVRLIAAISPWGDYGEAEDTLTAGARPPLRLRLDIGLREPFGAIEGVRALRELLLARGFREGRDLAYQEDEVGSHDEHSFRRRLPQTLEHLFPRRR